MVSKNQSLSKQIYAVLSKAHVKCNNYSKNLNDLYCKYTFQSSYLQKQRKFFLFHICLHVIKYVKSYSYCSYNTTAEIALNGLLIRLFFVTSQTLLKGHGHEFYHIYFSVYDVYNAKVVHFLIVK